MQIFTISFFLVFSRLFTRFSFSPCIKNITYIFVQFAFKFEKSLTNGLSGAIIIRYEQYYKALMRIKRSLPLHRERFPLAERNVFGFFSLSPRSSERTLSPESKQHPTDLCTVKSIESVLVFYQSKFRWYRVIFRPVFFHGTFFCFSRFQKIIHIY